jgi:endonuclease/exonuclease/phosphatase family metal-dependent hydrolase
MPSYNQHFLTKATAGRRTINKLLALREQLNDPIKGIPQRTQEDTLLLGTWNIRDFDKPSFRKRSEEAMHYIAEIVSRFDLLAVQEVYKDLNALHRLMGLLGNNWDYIVTDTSEGSSGNSERLAYIYDRRKVKFGGLAGELVLPPVKIDGKKQPMKQLARTPYIAGFKSGWTNFVLCTVHILYGKSIANSPERVEEIKQLAKFMKARATDATSWSQNVIVLGDFNIFSKSDLTMKALTDEGFVIPKKLQEIPGSNVPKNKCYDQIAFRVRPNRLETTNRAGVFDFYDVVYSLSDESEYVKEMGDSYKTTSSGKPRKSPSRYYKTYWRTHQMSDHLPMWVELKINYTESYLKRLSAVNKP